MSVAPVAGRDRLLWMNTSSLYKHSLFRPLYRLLRNAGYSSNVITEIWISRPDGSKMRMIGYLPREGVPGWPGPIHFSWLPDGRSISFLYGRNLWRLPLP